MRAGTVPRPQEQAAAILKEEEAAAHIHVDEAKLSRVKQEPVGVERQLRSIVKAHQDLIQLDGANEEKFGAFVNLVKQEFEKHG